MKPASRFERRVPLAFAAAAVVVLSLMLQAWRIAGQAADAAQELGHSQSVLADLARVRAETAQVELHTLAYRSSGDSARLQERDQALARRETLLERLHLQNAEHAAQQARWQQLREVVNERIALSRQIEARMKQDGPAAAQALVARSSLAETRRRAVRLLGDMEAAEREQLAARERTHEALRAQLLASVATLSLVLLGLLGGSFHLLRRELRDHEARRLALADSEESLACLWQSMADAVLATDTEGRVTRMNAVAEQLCGWPVNQALRRPVRELLPLIEQDSRLPLEIPLALVMTGGGTHSVGQAPLLCPREGGERPVSLHLSPIRDGNGRVRGLILVLREDERARLARQQALDQRAELERQAQEHSQRLHDSEQHLRSILGHVPALIAFIDTELRFVYANKRYCESFAPDLDELAGLELKAVLGEAGFASVAPLVQRALLGAAQELDWQPSPERWQALRYLPRFNEQGRVDGCYVLGVDITERHEARQALLYSQQQLARVIEGSDQGYWEWDLRSNHFQVSARWETMLGYQRGEMQVAPENWSQLVHPEDLPRALESIQRHLNGEIATHEFEIRVRTKAGEWHWILTRGGVVQRGADGTPWIMSGTHTDIHERKLLELAQREARVVFENCYEGIMVTQADGLITKVNPAFSRITGYSQEEVLGQSPRVLSSGRHEASFFQDFWQSLKEQDFWRGEIWNRRKDGDLFAALQSVSVVRDRQGRVSDYVSVFTDISQLKAHEAELNRVANFDPLTLLPNRRLLSDRLNQAIHRADRSGRMTAVCFLDLDGFKAINDQHGHAAGDELLIGVAHNLKQVLRVDDTLARLGGDEFVILLTELDSPEECALVLERLLRSVQAPVSVEGRELSISASVGVSLYPLDHADPDTLMRHADQAMYLAKQTGRNRYQLFDTEIDRAARQHREQLARLQQALQQDEFCLFYQPKVDLRHGAVVGVEALLRWQHPERGLLPPGEFLGQVHGGELERPLGEWVMEAALNQLETWANQGMDLPISINISATHLLQPGFSEHLADSLARHPRVAPARLELEVLETSALGEMQQAVAVLERCMALGVQFALDDFGTGYSSLTYLRKLPVATLKIDQSFVRDMLVDPDDLSIVKGVIELAHAFHREVIAEGVESLEHGARLHAMGCHQVQGYGIARPMPAEALPAWRAQWQAGQAWLHLGSD
ncbi:EAL domain-containing protein [Paucibacter sp. B51]|uniref:EAL domain-containing protein n=1 Tax=Paucibacter sp. B51 TaxID=2993315 RepID=UPI0022EBF5F2|nr:EAL domain-containing protein [Paucibacter sp. B51]